MAEKQYLPRFPRFLSFDPWRKSVGVVTVEYVLGPYAADVAGAIATKPARVDDS